LVTFEITLKLQGSKLVWNLTYIMSYISEPEVDIKKIPTLFLIASDAYYCAIKSFDKYRHLLSKLMSEFISDIFKIQFLQKTPMKLNATSWGR